VSQAPVSFHHHLFGTFMQNQDQKSLYQNCPYH